MSEATFNLKLLSNYHLVANPGTYYVSTAYTITGDNLFIDEHSRYIVPLRALTSEGLSELISNEELMSGKNIPFKDVRHLFLSGAVWDTDTFDVSDLPIKGERLLATFDFVDTVRGRRLLCTHIELLPREELEYVDTSRFDEFLLALNNLITKSIN
jgi:hypothetical protein